MLFRDYISTHFFFFASRRRHTRCALVTGVQTCALPISCLTPIGAADADDLLRVLAEAKLGSGEQAVDDIVVAADPVINELGAALGPRSEEHTLNSSH